MKLARNLLAAVGLILSGTMAHAQMPTEPVMLKIAEQSLTDALNALAEQTGLHVVFPAPAVEGKIAPRLEGRYTPEVALKLLLAGTRLSYEYVNARTIAIREAGAGAAGAVSSGVSALDERSATDRIRLAQAQIPAAQVNGSQAASTQSGPEGRLEEIIVTAQKREQRLTDVPISMVAMNGEDLVKRKIINVDDLVRVAPGVSIMNSGNQHRIFMRGIGNTGGSPAPLIGMYLDEAEITSVIDTHLNPGTFDLDRVEVLRGPQGTLYGQGSMGGTIRFVTRDPVLDRVDLGANVQASFSENGDPSQIIDGVVNVPLAQDTFGIRVAGSFQHDGGWIDHPAAQRKDYNDRNVTDIRLKSLWQPTEAFSARALAEVYRSDSGTSAGEDADGNYLQSLSLNVSPAVNSDYEIYNLTLNYDFPTVRLLSSTSYFSLDHIVNNYGYRYPVVDPATVGPADPSPILEILLAHSNRFVTSFSQEMRASSAGSSRLQWTFGGAYREFELDSDLLRFSRRQAFPDGTLVLVSTLKSKSWALFGDVSYQLTDRFTLGVGGRQFEDDQDYANPAPQSAKFDTFNPRYYVSFKASDSINTYASAAKGFRSGGFNGQTTLPAYGPESIWTYELGVKGAFPAANVSGELALFYSDYTDYQITGVELAQPFRSYTANSGSIHIKGVEWSMRWSPAERWTLDTGGSYVDSSLYELNLTSGGDHALGDQLDWNSKYTITAGAQRDFAFGGRDGFARLDYYRQGPQIFRLRNIGNYYVGESDVVDLLNLNVTFDWSRNLSAGFFAQNILNDRAKVDPLEIQQSATRLRPRTVGIQFGFRFE